MKLAAATLVACAIGWGQIPAPGGGGGGGGSGSGTVTSIATTGPITGGTITSTGTVACATCATTTNGGAISGTPPIAVSAAGVISGGGLGTVTGALKGNGSGTITQAACADLSNGGIGCSSSASSPAVNPQTATYQALASDFTWPPTLIPVASGTFTITLVASGSQPASGKCLNIVNYGSGTVTIARSGQNINGNTTSVLLPSGTQSPWLFVPSALICSDGTNYIASMSNPFGYNGGTGHVQLRGLNSNQFLIDFPEDGTSGQGILIPARAQVLFSSANNVGTSADTAVERDSAGVAAITNGTQGTTAANYRDLKVRHLFSSGTAPTISSGGGGTGAAINGADQSGVVTVGTSVGTGSITVTFGTAYAGGVFDCQATNQTHSSTIIADCTTNAFAGVGSGTYTSGISATGSAAQTCTLTITGGGGAGATATVALTGTNTIAGGTALVITAVGTGFASAPIAAAVSNGTATCSGSAVIATVLSTTGLTLTGYSRTTGVAGNFTASDNITWSIPSAH